MTINSPKTKLTGVYNAVARVAKSVARGAKAVVTDPLGIKRDKKRNDAFEARDA